MELYESARAVHAHLAPRAGDATAPRNRLVRSPKRTVAFSRSSYIVMTYRGFGRPALVAPEAGPICESLWRWHLGGGASQTRESSIEAEALGALVLAPARDGDEAERMGAAYSLGGCGDGAALAVLATGSLSLSLSLSPSLSLSLPPPTHPPTLSLSRSLAHTCLLVLTHSRYSALFG